MIDKNVYLLREIKAKKKYLHDYWYSLKYLVHALHAAYRLWYKVLGKYGNSSMCWRNKHHNLIKGPRPIAKNLAIFSDLVAFVDIQICLIVSIIQQSSDIKVQDEIAKISYKLVQYMDKIIWHENSWSLYTKNGLPVRYNWM